MLEEVQGIKHLFALPYLLYHHVESLHRFDDFDDWKIFSGWKTVRRWAILTVLFTGFSGM